MKSEKEESWTVDGFKVEIGAGMPYILGGIRPLRKEWDVSDQELAALKAGTIVERRDPWDCKVRISYIGTWTEGDDTEEFETGPFMKVEK